MSDFDKTLKMMESDFSDTRYDAIEVLRVSEESSEEVVTALEKATKDPDSYVAERARLALETDVHQAMLKKLGRARGFGQPALSSMKQCPFCNAEIPVEAVTCPACGTSVSTEINWNPLAKWFWSIGGLMAIAGYIFPLFVTMDTGTTGLLSLVAKLGLLIAIGGVFAQTTASKK